MKFSLAWADVAAQNTALKIALAAVSVSTVVLAAGVTLLGLKDPLIIERGLVTTAVDVKSGERTTQEMEAFVREALAQRFNSGVENSAFLSEKERHFKLEDHKKLKSSGLRQTVLPGPIVIKDHEAQIDADRLLAVGDVRSAFRFPMTALIYQVSRTEKNPYGLVLGQVVPKKLEEKK